MAKYNNKYNKNKVFPAFIKPDLISKPTNKPDLYMLHRLDQMSLIVLIESEINT